MKQQKYFDEDIYLCIVYTKFIIFCPFPPEDGLVQFASVAAAAAAAAVVAVPTATVAAAIGAVVEQLSWQR